MMEEAKMALATNTTTDVTEARTEAQNFGLSFIEHQQKLFAFAKTISNAQIVPAAYQNNAANCLIAIDMADRMGLPYLMVMQNLKPIKGNPSWSGQACISFIKNKYANAEHTFVGEEGKDNRGCYFSAVSSSGKLVKGTTVTIAMAKAEGWTANKKWQTMPEQMLIYRAAAFFARVYCPEVLMGCAVEGEAEDIGIRTRKADNPL